MIQYSLLIPKRRALHTFTTLSKSLILILLFSCSSIQKIDQQPIYSFKGHINYKNKQLPIDIFIHKKRPLIRIDLTFFGEVFSSILLKNQNYLILFLSNKTYLTGNQKELKNLISGSGYFLDEIKDFRKFLLKKPLLNWVCKSKKQKRNINITQCKKRNLVFKRVDSNKRKKWIIRFQEKKESLKVEFYPAQINFHKDILNIKIPHDFKKVKNFKDIRI